METKIQLLHPAGKKAVSMDRGKYDVLKTAILNHLESRGESSHKEIFQSISEDFVKNKIPFQGSVEWHMDWVTLDLEARKEIQRSGKNSPVKFAVTKLRD